MRHLRILFLDILRRRRALWELVRRDLEEQYLGSLLGPVWIILQPLAFMAVLYLVFRFGLRHGAAGVEVPFAVYLVCGLVPWFYVTHNLGAQCRVIRKHAFLVRRTDLRLSLLPAVPLLGSLAAHLLFVLLAVVLAALHGILPAWTTLQVFYYLAGMFLFLLGLGWLTAAGNVFVPDVGKAVGLAVQFGFWLTPIFWNPDLAPAPWRNLVYVNPVAYIVSGYRESIVLHVPFWNHPGRALWFWAVTALVLALGARVFRRLRPHFAEVL